MLKTWKRMHPLLLAARGRLGAAGRSAPAKVFNIYNIYIEISHRFQYIYCILKTSPPARGGSGVGMVGGRRRGLEWEILRRVLSPCRNGRVVPLWQGEERKEIKRSSHSVVPHPLSPPSFSPHLLITLFSPPSLSEREGGVEKRVISKSLIYYMYIYNRLRGRPGGRRRGGNCLFYI